MALIDKETIRAEIVRMREINKKALELGHITEDMYHGRTQAQNGLLAFLDTLEAEEKDVDLKKEIDMAFDKIGYPESFKDFNRLARHFYELGQCKKVNAPVDLEKAIHDWMLEIDGRYAILTHPPVDRVILETAKQFYDLGLNSKK